MINGYVTFDELLIITGFTPTQLHKLLYEGLACHELDITRYQVHKYSVPINERLFNLQEVEKWISSHIY